ncbi:lysophospholipid acyltransferase family protein [Palleronia caenipelagi]|uniref:1-acyl-sn-glycerol-3-phosphate acyltransferase n=1 Tax=Palleronia caenipelagi TaxID=2489174 RepID=A0A547PUP9_9RHOB|nr:lysophospholipid acyltransferase family protein [Palleronia caenipelagi]TRD17784.1 1-acyl-sn-glycerol-3-phosphate acyltransferase [Palleronia caenipelagi]
MASFFAGVLAALIEFLARIITAVRAIWDGVGPIQAQRIYFANHTSNGDFVLIWTVLPPSLRRRTRPVAAADYWLSSGLKRFVGREVFDAVLIERDPTHRQTDPVSQMAAALDGGSSLILFPEGTRNTGEEHLLPFKTGLYHLARHRPAVDLVPVWIENLNRVMPKGEVIPIPLLCTVRFGEAMRLSDGETRDDFLARCRAALLILSEKGPVT